MERGEVTTSLLLDTHAWVWLLEGAPGIPAVPRALIERTATAGCLWISAISVWEVAMLAAKGRLLFSTDVQTWIRQALAAPGLHLAPLSPEIAVASASLPGTFHGDPADRILVATARSLSARFVTADRAILAYGRLGHLKTVPLA
jgi:PIN domain nuclease of toxin-antitoxin system